MENHQDASIREVSATVEQVDEPSQAAVQLPISAVTASPSSRIKRMLIVDDDVKQRNSLMELIGEKDVIISAVSTGVEAIEALKVGQYDVLLLDLGLTDTTGFKLLEQMEADQLQEQLRIFIYTGRELTSKEEMFLNKYAHSIIIKNAHSPERLKDELELYLNMGREGDEVPDQAVQSDIATPTGLEGKKILLVDDDVRNVYALSSFLESYGVDIEFAENGVEALECLADQSSFDIVLMDIMMPEMDGYEAIRRIRANPKFASLPVIALTAKAMKDDREKCIAAGASDYITKPINQDQLINMLKVWAYHG